LAQVRFFARKIGDLVRVFIWKMLQDSMLLEYLPTFTQTKSPSHVGKYTSTMEHIGFENWMIQRLNKQT